MRIHVLALATLIGIGCSASPEPTPPQKLTRMAPKPPEPPPAEPAPSPSVVKAAEPPAPRCEPLEVELPEIPQGDADPPVVPIEDADRLAPFFERVARLLRGEADDHIRIAVYGDSNLTMDFQTGQMRRTLQKMYGDAGHGFVSFGRPWSHYKHMDVRHHMEKGWHAFACSTDPTPDRLYGIAGIAAASSSRNAVTWVETAAEDAPIGHTASRFDVYYLRGPRWGSFALHVDGEPFRTVDSHAEEIGLGVEHFELEDAPHRIEAVATDTNRRVRLFGVALERGEPSFVVDAFGVGSMNTESQWKQDPALNHEMLAHRGYDLVIFATGANDVFTLDVTPDCLGDIIERHRKALPNTPILLLTPADRGKTRTFPQTKLAIAQRRELAEKNDTALWDQFEAMGGEGSMRSFRERGLALHDHVHFNQKGGAYMGQRLTHALWSALSRHLEVHPKAGCEPQPRAEEAHDGTAAGHAAPSSDR